MRCSSLVIMRIISLHTRFHMEWGLRMSGQPSQLRATLVDGNVFIKQDSFLKVISSAANLPYLHTELSLQPQCQAIQAIQEAPKAPFFSGPNAFQGTEGRQGKPSNSTPQTKNVSLQHNILDMFSVLKVKPSNTCVFISAFGPRQSLLSQEDANEEVKNKQ